MDMSNDNLLDMMAKIAEAAAHQTRDGIVELLTYLAKQSLLAEDVPNHVANTLLAAVSTIKQADVADFFATDDE